MIEYSPNTQDITPSAFLGIEGTLDKARADINIRTVTNYGIEDTIWKWIKTMLVSQ